ncbi:MAG TPA: N-acyl homoserine lactonase family protein [Solirubrobacterales bacterium]|nr:N-acyl homoserine lactonase family protein [Solirubrobacterales bacterium]
MSMHVQPNPLDQPLPGGQAGATVTVEPMVTGELQMVPEAMESSGGRVESLRIARGMLAGGAPRVPVPCFLIRHPGAGAILVDTGLHPSVTTDPRLNFGRILARVLAPSLAAGEDVVSQVRRRGVDPEEIRTVILTHLHVEHASAISELPDATFIVTLAEWEAATGARPTGQGYRHSQYDHAFDYRTVSYDGSQINSYAGFGRTFDLFGDSSVRLAYTPGHTAGHQSVICRLGERDFVIGGDVAYMERQIKEEGALLPASVADEHNYRRSLREVRLFHDQYPDAVITPGHDPSFYARAEAKYS